MSRPSLSQVGAAVLATLRAGTYASAAIRASLSDGSEVRPPQVVVTSPAVGFQTVEEGFLLGASEWGLVLYSANGREPSTGVELAFLDAVIASLVADPTLGGVVTCAYLEGADEAVAVATSDDAPPTMYRRALRLHVDH